MTGSIIEILNRHSQSHKHKKAFVFINENGDSVDELTYAALRNDAEKVASFLQRNCQPKERVLLLFQPGLDYIRALFGCFIAGVIAVPLYPPRKNKKAERILSVAESCDCSLILCGEQDKDTIISNFDGEDGHAISSATLNIITMEMIKASNDSGGHFTLPQASDVAFLQYTSGSTGVPKGVMINHQNALGNVLALSDRIRPDSGDVFVNWLPLFHDLGLITAVMWPVYLGATSVLISPAHFVRNPKLWLDTISKYRGSICGAPNFAYQLCCKKIPEDVLASLDLSSWQVAYNTAEPVQLDTIQKFNQQFAAAKLSPLALMAGYGMAEATAFISCGDVEQTITVYDVDAADFANHKITEPTSSTTKTQAVIGCGRIAEYHDIRIVDPNTRQELMDNQIGEIWFAGPSVSEGYWGLAEISKETFGQSLAGSDHKYMRTGDFGFLRNGEVFITGRIKDIVIIEGRNYYPQDIEWNVEKYNREISAGSCAAFSQPSDEGEKLIIVAEINRTSLRSCDFAEVIKNIRQKLINEFFIYPKQVALVKPLSMPKTSSGKIQRKLTKAMLENHDLDIVFSSDQMASNEYIAPVTDLEIRLCAIVAKLLKKERVGLSDNFFDMGGKSLTAMELIGEIKQSFNDIELNFEHLFAFETIKDMAQHIEKRIKLDALHEQRAQQNEAIEGFEI